MFFSLIDGKSAVQVLYCTRFGTFEHFANNIDSISFLLTTFYGALCREGKNTGYFKSSLSKMSEEYRRDPSTEQLIVPPRLKNMEQIKDIVCGTCPTCPTTVKLPSITFFTQARSYHFQVGMALAYRGMHMSSYFYVASIINLSYCAKHNQHA